MLFSCQQIRRQRHRLVMCQFVKAFLYRTDLDCRLCSAGSAKTYWKSPSKTNMSSPGSPPLTPSKKRFSDEDHTATSSKLVKLSHSWQEKGKAKARNDTDEEILTNINDDESVPKDPMPPVEKRTRHRSTRKF
jgi:hypothetical protein